ncbi:hypothetical protein HZ326_2253 [Fusarium oxysporum f. sp. albedinis]|nr:hypothetical protein HZ326_2253 [Fusarium oxysporum f. sp. albedinis]
MRRSQVQALAGAIPVPSNCYFLHFLISQAMFMCFADMLRSWSVVSGLLRKGIVRYSVLLQESHGKQFSQPSCVISQFDRGYGHGHGHGMHLAAMPIWFAPAACG